MDRISRRDFLKLCAGSVAAVGLSQLLYPELAKAAPASGKPPVIWLQGLAVPAVLSLFEFRPAGDERDPY